MSVIVELLVYATWTYVVTYVRIILLCMYIVTYMYCRNPTQDCNREQRYRYESDAITHLMQSEQNYGIITYFFFPSNNAYVSDVSG